MTFLLRWLRQGAVFQEIAYPEQVLIGLAISHLGNSSLRYALGCFTGTL